MKGRDKHEPIDFISGLMPECRPPGILNAPYLAVRRECSIESDPPNPTTTRTFASIAISRRRNGLHRDSSTGRSLFCGGALGTPL